MDDDLFKLADTLTSAIKNSKCYNDYLISKEQIKEDSKLCDKIREFKSLHIDLQKKKLNNEEISFDYERDISKRYYNLILNENVKTFLENEQILIKLMGDIYNRISTECVLDFDL